ncbi:uncharacterized protein SPPG_01101 [Spizellomyces punctatus DAOM BR117]|uniref:Uncharacterized protein n=1 Tax=Spizellomyces punctatus (strain DAOM BR117) TaxID=645134 RepID=A0A0L0HRV7_SPIPD|nr:uncharacterized protein SPPG_01101 [Spizellomyces punctatus DAOM BR117]KND03625.1 hypothetical protein SPPG_01101 [Spizellomyces punctatus DAOM BR117]|eukprot:XP_016611664.1 hypothetical protein SPPG_01101 [Spizellomyces punctatus DAOM BR117]
MPTVLSSSRVFQEPSVKTPMVKFKSFLARFSESSVTVLRDKKDKNGRKWNASTGSFRIKRKQGGEPDGGERPVQVISRSKSAKRERTPVIVVESAEEFAEQETASRITVVNVASMEMADEPESTTPLSEKDDSDVHIPDSPNLNIFEPTEDLSDLVTDDLLSDTTVTPPEQDPNLTDSDDNLPLSVVLSRNPYQTSLPRSEKSLLDLYDRDTLERAQMEKEQASKMAIDQSQEHAGADVLALYDQSTLEREQVMNGDTTVDDGGEQKPDLCGRVASERMEDQNEQMVDDGGEQKTDLCDGGTPERMEDQSEEMVDDRAQEQVVIETEEDLMKSEELSQDKGADAQEALELDDAPACLDQHDPTETPTEGTLPEPNLAVRTPPNTHSVPYDAKYSEDSTSWQEPDVLDGDFETYSPSIHSNPVPDPPTDTVLHLTVREAFLCASLGVSEDELSEMEGVAVEVSEVIQDDGIGRSDIPALTNETKEVDNSKTSPSTTSNRADRPSIDMRPRSLGRPTYNDDDDSDTIPLGFHNYSSTSLPLQTNLQVNRTDRKPNPPKKSKMQACMRWMRKLVGGEKRGKKEKGKGRAVESGVENVKVVEAASGKPPVIIRTSNVARYASKSDVYLSDLRAEDTDSGTLERPQRVSLFRRPASTGSLRVTNPDESDEDRDDEVGQPSEMESDYSKSVASAGISDNEDEKLPSPPGRTEVPVAGFEKVDVGLERSELSGVELYDENWSGTPNENKFVKPETIRSVVSTPEPTPVPSNPFILPSPFSSPNPSLASIPTLSRSHTSLTESVFSQGSLDGLYHDLCVRGLGLDELAGKYQGAPPPVDPTPVTVTPADQWRWNVAKALEATTNARHHRPNPTPMRWREKPSRVSTSVWSLHDGFVDAVGQDGLEEVVEFAFGVDGRN